MTKRQKTWVYSPPKGPKPTVPEDIKKEVEAKAATVIEAVLKPQHIKPPPEDALFNYLVDIYSKWYRSYFYFCSKYHSPGPHAISPSFEDNFARLEYAGEGRFNVSYKRHTGKWMELYSGLTVEESLAAVQDELFLRP